jgi:hypothetical protein
VVDRAGAPARMSAPRRGEGGGGARRREEVATSACFAARYRCAGAAGRVAQGAGRVDASRCAGRALRTAVAEGACSVQFTRVEAPQSLHLLLARLRSAHRACRGERGSSVRVLRSCTSETLHKSKDPMPILDRWEFLPSQLNWVAWVTPTAHTCSQDCSAYLTLLQRCGMHVRVMDVAASQRSRCAQLCGGMPHSNFLSVKAQPTR